MKTFPVLLTVLLLATAACAPMPAETTRLSTHGGTACTISPDTCAGLHRVRASQW